MVNNYLNTQEALKTFKTLNKRTNFEKVLDWNKTFDIETYEEPQKDIFCKNPELVNYRMNLIREEVGELEDAVKTHNMVETYDALSDILFVVYGMGASLGLDLDKGLHLVNESNMSKSCKTEEEAIKTVEWYKKNEERYDSPMYRKSKNGKYWIVYNKSTNKILKNVSWKTVNFEEIIE